MNRIFIAFAVPALALSALAQAPGSPDRAGFARAGVEAPDPPSPEQELLRLVNIERQHLGLAALQWDDKVARAAQAHSQKLASHRALSHQFSGEPELTQRVGATGARFNAVAENVAMASDPEEAHLALMNSPGHRANILNPKYNVAGIAVVRVNKQIYVTEDFAHAVPAYTEQEFRDGVVTAFNALRRAHNLGPIDSRADSGLDHQACTGGTNLEGVLGGQNQASRAAGFTATEPGQLPAPMQQAAADVTLRRMNIGVCYVQDSDTKFPKFWVIATFSQFKQ